MSPDSAWTRGRALKGRAIRRQQASRAKGKARRLLRHWNWVARRLFPESSLYQPDLRTVGIFAGTRTPCSESCCGNARKHWGETAQERRYKMPPDLKREIEL